MCSAKAAVDYLSQSDYYSTSPGELLGNGFQHLDISNMLPRDVMECLAHNLDPATGKILRPHAKDGDRVGMDMTFTSPKSVGIAREMAGPNNEGDPRIEAAHREAVKYAMDYVEKDMQTRVRVGGADHDRTTGNLCAYRVTHRDSRINAEDQKPDPHLHCHVFVMNLTHDSVEDKFKAAQMANIKHDAPYYESLYNHRLASNLRDLGYGIRRDGKSFEIAGIDRPLIDKFSRRHAYIKKTEQAIEDKIGRKLSAEAKSKLGATTRLGKAKEQADDLNGYYVSRLTNEERERLGHLEFEPSFTSNAEKAVTFAIGHLFERQSVVEERKLYETAIRHGVGSSTPEEIKEEAIRQGGLLKDGKATTKAVLAEESRIIEFAREGKGTMRPLAPPDAFSLAKTDHLTLSAEQLAMVSHVLTSSDQVTLVIGDAGTGKTHAVKTAFDQIRCPVAMLAPSAEASRGVLRKEGFANADTVASFLMKPEQHAKVKNGVIWVDEAGLLAIKDLSKLVDIAEQQNARIILQGDPKQHSSPARHGNMMNVLQEYAGLPVGRLTEIWRQKHKGYKTLVADIAQGEREKAFDQLAKLGWVQKVENNDAIVNEYVAGIAAGKDVLLIAPSHVEGDEVTAAIRKRLQDDGKLGTEERLFEQLVPLNWTEPERGDLERYDGSEVMKFNRGSGTFKAGQTVSIADWKPGDHFKSPEHFSVYRKDEIGFTAGDLIRFTANGTSLDGHDLNNGSVYRIKGFDKKDNIILDNGWTVGKSFKHMNHGYVKTSIGAQGKTVDRILIAMGSESRGAINAEQFYVSVSRARESAKVFSDLTPVELKQEIQRTAQRISATELMHPKKKPKSRRRKFLDRMKSAYLELRDRVASVMREPKQQEKEQSHER